MEHKLIGKNKCRVNEEEKTITIVITSKHGYFESIVDNDERIIEILQKYKMSIRYYTKRKHYVNFRYGKKIVNLHRFLLNFPDRTNNTMVDHLNENKLDNRLSNLRLVDNSTNQHNVSECNKNNITGIRGVWWHRPTQKYRCGIRINYKFYWGGAFEKIEDAIESRKGLEKMYKENYEK